MIAHEYSPALRTHSRRRCRVHRIPPPTFVTIASRPSYGVGRADENHIFLKNRSDLFFAWGWTGIRERCPSGKSLARNEREVAAAQCFLIHPSVRKVARSAGWELKQNQSAPTRPAFGRPPSPREAMLRGGGIRRHVARVSTASWRDAGANATICATRKCHASDILRRNHWSPDSCPGFPGAHAHPFSSQTSRPSAAKTAQAIRQEKHDAHDATT
jgi:hypothetical protein